MSKIKKKKKIPRGRNGGRNPLPEADRRRQMSIVVSFATWQWLRSRAVRPGNAIDSLFSGVAPSEIAERAEK